MKQNTFLFLLTILIFSCSKEKKTVPKELICKVNTMDDYRYSYNDKGELISLQNTFIIKEFKYEGNKIHIAQYSKLSPAAAEKNTTITLDSEGRIQKFIDDNFTFDAKYDASGYLIEVKCSDTMYGDLIATSYMTYMNGNLVRINKVFTNGIEESNISYTDILNKSNNGFYANFPLAETFNLRCSELVSYLGKGSKNLIKEINKTYVHNSSLNSKDIWSFTLNENGNIAKASFKYTSTSLNYGDTFNFSYKCN